MSVMTDHDMTDHDRSPNQYRVALNQKEAPKERTGSDSKSVGEGALSNAI